MLSSLPVLPPPAPSEKSYKKVTRANELFERHQYYDAVVEYSKILQTSKGSSEYLALIYSNRSASYLKLNEYERARQDAIKTIELAPLWSKVR